jgi:hypothetical protein
MNESFIDYLASKAQSMQGSYRPLQLHYQLRTCPNWVHPNAAAGHGPTVAGWISLLLAIPVTIHRVAF